MPPLNVSTAQCLFVGSPTSITSLLGKKGGIVSLFHSWCGGISSHTRGGFRVYFERTFRSLESELQVSKIFYPYFVFFSSQKKSFKGVILLK